MDRSRYKIYEPTHPHFITCTVLNWIPLFTRKESEKTILEQLVFYKKDHKVDREYQLWQEGIQSKLMQTDVMMKVVIFYKLAQNIKSQLITQKVVLIVVVCI